MCHKDYVTYNDTYTAQKAFCNILRLEKSGSSLQYWACLIRPLVLPSPIYHPQLLLHQLTLSVTNHEVLLDMIQSAALRASDYKLDTQWEAQATSGLQMIMESLYAQVGSKKQIEVECFRKFWQCCHQPATLHNKAWGLFVYVFACMQNTQDMLLRCTRCLSLLIYVCMYTLHSRHVIGVHQMPEPSSMFVCIQKTWYIVIAEHQMPWPSKI